MFLVSYEDNGHEPKNLATASNMASAKYFIAKKMKERGASDIFEWEGETDEQGRVVFSLGDAQYVIEALVHVS